jgi:dolichol-phosphate mannosyltransferase
MKKKILIFTATYNEINNVEYYFEEIFKLNLDFNLLIIDDNSPDLTWKRLKELEKVHKNFELIIREKKLGLHTAHHEAFKYANDNNYDYLITMDIDSHQPKSVPEIINNLDLNYDFVIGSRYMVGGRCDYTGYRSFISQNGNNFIRNILNINLHEFTTSFRGFNLKKIKKFDMNKLKFKGYSFLMETVYRINSQGYKIKEIPIHFEERRRGNSKISKTELPRTFFNVIRLFIEKNC